MRKMEFAANEYDEPVLRCECGEEFTLIGAAIAHTRYCRVGGKDGDSDSEKGNEQDRWQDDGGSVYSKNVEDDGGQEYVKIPWQYGSDYTTEEYERDENS